jgi:hypothetical protein
MDAADLRQHVEVLAGHHLLRGHRKEGAGGVRHVRLGEHRPRPRQQLIAEQDGGSRAEGRGGAGRGRLGHALARRTGRCAAGRPRRVAEASIRSSWTERGRVQQL